MKVLYDKKEYVFNITKEDLQKYTPEQLAYMMIDRIERMMFAETMKTAINKMNVGKLTIIQKRSDEKEVTGCFNCKRALWDMDGCTCKLTGLQVGNVSLGCEHRKER